jgi:gamma-glutamylcyclotransferase (GGCT)/AIG2-like uncharacterized protein YtfP
VPPSTNVPSSRPTSPTSRTRPTSPTSPTQPTSPTSGRLAARSADSAPLFVYGTLLFPDVLHILIGRDPARTPATVPGWRVATIPGRIYPTLIPDPAATARGHLLTDLTDAEWQILDAFEADEYHFTRLHPAGTHPHAWAYTAPDPDVIPPTPWNPDTFAAVHLPAYLDRCAAWCRRYEAGE